MDIRKPMRSTFFLVFSTAALAACGPEAEPGLASDTVRPAAEEPVAEIGTAISHHTYCFERVGQIGLDGNQDEPRRGDACSIHGSGVGEATGDTGNTVRIHISAASLERAGLGSVSFILNRGHGIPKFPTGVQTVDQMRRKDLPTRMVLGSDITRKSSFFVLTGPDADKVRKDNPGMDFPGYEIDSAVLQIDSAVDVPELDHNVSTPGFETGDQFIEGTLSLSLIPMGNNGEQYGPTTFEFRTEIGWGVMK